MLSAQQIDTLEARRDSDDALARAFQYAKAKRLAERARIAAIEIRDVSSDYAASNSIFFLPAHSGAAPGTRTVSDDQPTPRLITTKTNSRGFHRKAKQFEAFGRTQTIAEWAYEYSFHPETIRKRVRDGSTIEHALTGNFKTGGSRPTVFYTAHGETLTLTEWSRRTGLSFPTLRYRISHGFTIEEALASKMRERTGREPSITITFKGETLTIAEWSERSGLSATLLRKRLRMGWSAERVLTKTTVAGGGVGRSSAPGQETGGVSIAQDTAELEVFQP